MAYIVSCVFVSHVIQSLDVFSFHQNRSDLDSDMENVTETAELRAAGADDSCDEEVYVPLIPQRYLYVLDDLEYLLENQLT